MISGHGLLLLLPGDSIPAETVSVSQVVVLPAVELPLPDAVVVVTTHHARMIAETEIVTVTTSDATGETASAVLTTGKKMPTFTYNISVVLIQPL